jgi:ketosteroid isomerase-like protein
MMNQQKSWNLADIDGYMSYYWGSDSLLFVTGDKVRKGWQNIRDNYEKKYPDSTAMGTLEYSKLFFYKIDKKKVFCTGSWAITRADGKLEGTFTLIWSKIKNRWVIIMDHTE